MDIKSNKALQDQIKQECWDALRRKNPLLAYITEIKVVCNPRRNFINMIVKQDFQDMIFHKTDPVHGNHCCFFMSNKFEPFVIVIVLNDFQGRLTYLDEHSVKLLEHSIADFKHNFQIQNEKYYYTATEERHQEAAGFAPANRSHSKDFHLKIRINSQMLCDKMRIYQIINLPQLRNNLEVLRYQFDDRKLDSYDDCILKIRNDFLRK